MTTRTLLRSMAGAAGLFAAVLAAAPATAQDATHRQGDTVKIRIAIDGAAIPVTLEDSEAARDFASLLPLTVTLTDYASTEKVADLPRRLNTADAPAGIDPAVGDVTYYAPWGNLAIFVKDFGYARGLVKLGRVEAGLGSLARPGPIRATIERVEE